MRITSKGQVTIPAAIREKAGLLPETEVEFVLERGAVRIIKKRSKGSRARDDRGQRLLAGLRGSATVKLSTDEILAMTRGR